MCLRCNDVFDTGAIILNDILACRKEYSGADETAAQNVTVVARVLIESLNDVGDNPYVQNLCLGLAVAVERLVALEQCGIPTA